MTPIEAALLESAMMSLSATTKEERIHAIAVSMALRALLLSAILHPRYASIAPTERQLTCSALEYLIEGD